MHSSYIASYIAIVTMLIISNIITKLAAVTPVYTVNNHTSILSILTASIYLQNQQVQVTEQVELIEKNKLTILQLYSYCSYNYSTYGCCNHVYSQLKHKGHSQLDSQFNSVQSYHVATTKYHQLDNQIMYLYSKVASYVTYTDVINDQSSLQLISIATC